jgi:hypothetical protein
LQEKTIAPDCNRSRGWSDSGVCCGEVFGVKRVILKAQGSKPKAKRSKTWIFVSLFFLGTLAIPVVTMGQEVNGEGWSIPDLRGLIPYSIQIKNVNGVEKIVEKFLTSDGGHVARISGNGKIFAYAADSDKEPPIDYLILDPDGSHRRSDLRIPTIFLNGSLVNPPNQVV